MASWDDVRRLALALPETHEKASHGHAGGAAWAVKDKVFAWERALRKGDLAALGDAAPDGPVLAVRVEHLVAKEALLGDEGPAACFTTPHFEGYPSVLVALDDIALDELDELLTEAWLARAPKRLAARFLADHGSG